MRLFATLVFAALITGCPSTPAPPSKADAKDVAKDVKKEASPPSAQPSDRAIEPGASELPASEIAITPAWFDTAKIAHAKILQPINQAKVGASMASATLLELAPGTTTADCMANVRTEMAKTIPDLAEAVPGEKDRLTLHGKAEDYSYTVVCGPGKDGQTTLYLSYTGLPGR